MASPNTTFTSGAVLTAAQMNNLPFGLMGTPKRITAAQNTITTVVDITNATLAFTGIANRWYKATYSANGTVTTGGSTFRFLLTDSSNTTVVGGIFDHQFIGTYSDTVNVIFYFQATGSVTRKVRALLQAGGGSMSLYGDATIPATFIIEDIGSV